MTTPLSPHERYRQNLFLSLKEVWELGVLPYGYNKIRKLLAAGEIKSIKNGLKYQTKREWIQTYLDGLC